jgi:glycerol-3-phosphate acyltransferase PlsY
MQWLAAAALIFIGYLFGSIPFSFLLARLHGVDLRKVGSGNTGASNVWRNLGFKWFVLALTLDLLKGFVPTALAHYIFEFSPLAVVFVGLAAMLGHVYPLFLGFRGGKAVATSGGVMFAMHPLLLIASALIWTVIYKLSGYPSVASLLGMVIIALLATTMAMTGRLYPEYAAFIWFILIMLTYLHRANIERLMQGTENRIGRKTK